MVDYLLYALQSALAVGVAFVIHEWAHARMAYQLGDPVPKYEGRLSLNPIVHLDPIGSLVLLVSIVLTKGMAVLGWGKPVRFEESNLKQPRWDIPLIALAGPLSNLLLAFLVGLVVILGQLKITFLWLLISANLGLMLFNFIPCPPLDGWKIAGLFVPDSKRDEMQRFEEKYGRHCLVALLVVVLLTGRWWIYPIFSFLMRAFTGGYFS